MHSYLKAIGFGKIEKESEAEKLMEEIFKNFDNRSVAKEDKTVFIEMRKEYAPDMGIAVCGIMDEEGFHRQYYFPYYNGSGITTTEDLTVEKRVSGEAYSGVCDDGRVGVSIIFYLQNAAVYKREQFMNQLFGKKTSVTLSGLASGGMILLPVVKNLEQNDSDSRMKSWTKRNQLMSAAKNGDPEAIESLTIEDMDLYSMVSRRIYQEDVYSIIDTFFMPFGVECDQYQIMGNILFYTKVRNSMTKEYVYQMTLECNDLVFDVCINESDLMGDPEVGRRFKGNIWLQGKINFE